ncbi:hypothetical protein QYM36_011996 [Artemia franciscana]|uniref:SOUL heme-binding protein n=1 Tax=Artemia franciscana TaxID=6661 RepID=A0AA88KZG9_ARTSF|nr:hypothetical protein QYM36_011996 [Artemia franciscana]
MGFLSCLVNNTKNTNLAEQDQNNQCRYGSAMKTIVVFLVLVAYTKAAVEETPYEVIETAADYEIRRYPQRKWVATTLEALSYDSVTNALFQTLFQYIDGGNSEGAIIPMTAPVTSLVAPGASTESPSTFTMAFYIPEEFQASPPSPTNPNIFIEDRPEFELYSRWVFSIIFFAF